MAITPASLQSGIVLTASSQTIYTATKTCVITSSVFTNSSSDNSDLIINITRSGSTEQILIPSRTINSGSTSIPGELSGLVLNSGDTLSGTGAGILAILSGYIIS